MKNIQNGTSMILATVSLFGRFMIFSPSASDLFAVEVVIYGVGDPYLYKFALSRLSL